MSIEELLRSLIDKLDRIENSGSQPPVVVHVHNNTNGSSSAEVSNTDEEHEPTGRFTPPLQNKIELLKKSAGLRSVFDLADDDGPFES
jgi:hypothetical protein